MWKRPVTAVLELVLVVLAAHQLAVRLFVIGAVQVVEQRLGREQGLRFRGVHGREVAVTPVKHQ